MLRVVGVESEFDEFVSSVWVVVSDGADCDVAGDAHGVGLDDCGSEGAVSAAVVAAGCCCASCLIGCGPMGGTPATLGVWVDRWVSMH